LHLTLIIFAPFIKAAKVRKYFIPFMKILVNTRLLIKNKLDGIGWFTFETLKRITQNHPEVKFYFLFDRLFSEEFIFSDNIEPIVIGPPTRHPVLWYFWFEYQIPKIIRRLKPDLFVSPDGYLSLRGKVKSLPVIHDINFLHYPKDLPWSSRLFYNYFFPKYAKNANRIATVSEYSKTDMCKNYGVDNEKVDVLYNGSNQVYKPVSPATSEEVKREYTNGNNFFIFIGSLHPRKNVANMLKAYEKFREKNSDRVDFVIIGEKFFMTKDIKHAWESMMFKNDVYFIGRMEPERMRDLLASAIALVLVSKLEGFGIPVIEAYNCGTPAILSNVSSLPEVGANAALYADPFSIESITKAMSKMVNEEGLRDSLAAHCPKIAARYSWDKTAERFWDSITKTIEGH
jgi:glycosyltransferase involved in cell wall biosynthesis